MVRYDEKIINKLLDTYESSILSTGENQRTIYIEFPFTKKTLAAYFDQSSDEYEKIHAAMQELENEGLIQIIWRNKRKGHIISRVRLNTECLEQNYQYVGRVPKASLITNHLVLLREFSAHTESAVCRNFISYIIKRLKENKSVKEYIQLENTESTGLFLRAIESVEGNLKPMYVREFSIHWFRDSKIFESMVGKVHKVFLRFCEQSVSGDNEEWLAEHNIYQKPNFVYVKGNASISINGNTVRLIDFQQGLGISGDDIERIKIEDISHIDRVLTIENLTTYFRWKEERGLIIYLGGYHNTVRRNLLKKIYSSVPDAEYYHFGDIDAGGFAIYQDLCDKTGIPFSMYHMDVNTLSSYRAFGKKLTQNDRERLEKLKSQVQFEEVISYMLTHDVKLEQECVIQK